MRSIQLIGVLGIGLLGIVAVCAAPLVLKKEYFTQLQQVPSTGATRDADSVESLSPDDPGASHRSAGNACDTEAEREAGQSVKEGPASKGRTGGRIQNIDRTSEEPAKKSAGPHSFSVTGRLSGEDYR
jgi:hypothetical protein